MKFNSENFFYATDADFQSCEKPNRKADYTSNSGSQYWYTEDGVIRGSNHWGMGIATCNWTLDGKAYGYGMHPYKRVWTGERWKVTREYADGATAEQINEEMSTTAYGFTSWNSFKINNNHYEAA